ncbi:MAG: SH3 domain-containing protein [Chloroflexota bacterium]
MPTKLILSLLAVSLLTAGCSITIQTELPTAIPTTFITATLPPSLTPPPSATSTPPPPTPTAAPVPGTTSTQVNVRAEPSTAGEVLGILAANVSVQIVGRDPGGNWWQILYEAGPAGKGWVTAQYIRTATQPEVPLIGGGEAGSAPSAVVIQQLNVRSGPGTGFNSIGILNANDVVRLTGKNREGAWLQIEFAGGADGKGWVNAAFVRAEGVDVLPIVADTGEVVGTGTPANTPPPPTPTVVPAPMDLDSPDAPLKTILFERAGTHALIYNGEVSTPQGDPEDWIAFTPYGSFVFVSLQCTGNGSLRAEIAASGLTFACNEAERVVPVTPGAAQLIHIEAVPTSGALQAVTYTLTIQARP